MATRKPKILDPRLPPLLEKHGLTLEQYWKQGRPPKEVSVKRRALMTELHLAGHSWQEMYDITGYWPSGKTDALWNEASRSNRCKVLVEYSRAQKGKAKPQFSDLLRRAWAEGAYDFHKLKLSEDRKRLLKASWTPQLRAEISARSRSMWSSDSHRQKLLAFHRDPRERARRSAAQTLRMVSQGGHTRSIPQQVCGFKCSNQSSPFRVRSTYEAAAVRVLEADPLVLSYQYEPVLTREAGGFFLPDFILSLADGSAVLVEVKASWVLKLARDHASWVRLGLSSDRAQAEGWGFEIWTEADRLQEELCRGSKK